MLSSAPATIDFVTSLWHACAWAGLLAFGAGLALVVGQNRQLRRRTLRAMQFLGVLLGAIASGLVAGAAGQGTFYALSGLEAPELPGRMVAWVLLAGGIALGMSYFVPNLPRRRASIAGALAGALAAYCFLRIVPTTGDSAGRLLGARRSWTDRRRDARAGRGQRAQRVPWSCTGAARPQAAPRRDAHMVGRSASAHLHVVGPEPAEVIGFFTRDAGGNHFEDKRSGKKRRLRAGDRPQFGSIVVEVRDAGVRPGRREAPPRTTKRTRPRGGARRRARSPRAPLPERARARGRNSRPDAAPGARASSGPSFSAVSGAAPLPLARR
jgi:hypothetical protein